MFAYIPYLPTYLCHVVVAEASNTLKSEFLREIEMLKKISCGNCPYIVNVVGCSTHEEPLALILEYAPNGDLLTYLRTLRKMVCYSNKPVLALNILCIHTYIPLTSESLLADTSN